MKKLTKISFDEGISILKKYWEELEIQDMGCGEYYIRSIGYNGELTVWEDKLLDGNENDNETLNELGFEFHEGGECMLFDTDNIQLD